MPSTVLQPASARATASIDALRIFVAMGFLCGRDGD
jgi:hypothetical protein